MMTPLLAPAQARQIINAFKGLQPWLQDSGSFMQRCRLQGLNPEIQVLKQAWCLPSREERFKLGLALRRFVFYREVLIHHQQEPLLLARAVIPAATLSGPERQLAHLGTRALGSLLFAYADLERSAFEFGRYELPSYSTERLWGRSSIFYFRQKHLLLTEVFLPGLLTVMPAQAGMTERKEARAYET